jgi:hypothetical protein
MGLALHIQRQFKAKQNIVFGRPKSRCVYKREGGQGRVRGEDYRRGDRVGLRGWEFPVITRY